MDNRAGLTLMGSKNLSIYFSSEIQFTNFDPLQTSKNEAWKDDLCMLFHFSKCKIFKSSVEYYVSVTVNYSCWNN